MSEQHEELVPTNILKKIANEESKFNLLEKESVVYIFPMDEGTIKTPIPKCRLYWCFLGWGVV